MSGDFQHIHDASASVHDITCNRPDKTVQDIRHHAVKLEEMLVASTQQPLIRTMSKAHSQCFDLHLIFACLKAHLGGVCSLGMSVTRVPLCCPALMLGRAKEGEVSLLAAACTFSSPSGNTCT